MSQIDKIINGMQAAPMPSDYWESSNIEFPELMVSKTIIQHNNQSVWGHTMSVIDILTIKNPITLLSGLFHDLGKGYIISTDDPSLPRFPGHSQESSCIAQTTLKEWGASSYLIDRVLRLICMHMYDIKIIPQEKSIRKFIANVGLDNIDNWFVLRIADSCSYASHQRYYNRLIEPFRVAVMSYLKQQPSADRPEFASQDEIGNICIEGGDC